MEIWRLSAVELAVRVRGREISARAAAVDALARLDSVNPAVNAVVECRPADVLAQADAVDAAVARGDDPGALAGVLVTVKVNLDQAGFATTGGTRLQEHLMAEHDNPVVANLRRAGAVMLGRTNTPAFSLRWFTSNLVHGATRNPRDRRLTPGGSSGGAAAAVTCGIGQIAIGTDIAGSIRYPAYACGVHGLRPSFGRVAAYNASLPERAIGAQLTSVAGPLARNVGDLRVALAALAGADARDPWWVPAPLVGPAREKRAALCLRPGGMEPAAEVVAALVDAAARLRAAGWRVDEVEDVPALREAAELQTAFWIGDGFANWEDLARRDGDAGAISVIGNLRALVAGVTPADIGRALTRRATLGRMWAGFLAEYAVLVLPVSAEPPFVDDLDMVDFDRVWRAQLTQIGLAFLGVPALAVATGMAGGAPMGVQVVAGRFREDLCLAAGEAIEAGGVPLAPVDPV